MFRCCCNEERLSGKVFETQTTPVLLEIVGAMGFRRVMDLYCVVKINDKDVHRTKVVHDDDSPIWTVLTGSLCLLKIPVETALRRHTTSEVSISLHYRFITVGKVELLFEELLNGRGERQERMILSPTENHAYLAFRSRPATEDDILFFERTKHVDIEGLASDINFRTVAYNGRFRRHRKFIEDKEYFLVRPGPDPSRPRQETQWLMKEQIETETMKPSHNWISVGHGRLGTIYLEVLSCHGLPNMDLAQSSFVSDPFVGIVFEDAMVRTNIIWNSLNPHWLPWTNRAFMFKVRHPTSLLMLGVFDYDDVLTDHHDPIGRVVINTSFFRNNTEYILHYKLHHDPDQIDAEPRGTIRIRLRVEWEDESEAMQLTFATAPRCVINVDNEKSYRVLKYITRGSMDMDEVTIDTLKLYLRELLSYRKNLCYVLDVFFEIFLWRGRLKYGKGRSVWFPLHSVVLFAGSLLLIERPDLVIPIYLYGISWILLSINYHLSRHPSPWKQVKKSEEVNMMALSGRSHFNPVTIEPNQGVEEDDKLEQLDAMKTERMMKLITVLFRFALKVHRIYSKTNLSSFDMTTDTASKIDFRIIKRFVANRLTYLHTAVKSLCQTSRLIRNFINWESYATDVVTTNCFMLATLWLIFPFNTLVLWIIRLLALVFLGPWMKLVDILWVHSWYETKDELLDRIERGDCRKPCVPDFDSMLESDFFRKMVHSGRIVAETALKEKEMREKLFGPYSEAVPHYDNSRFPSVPLPQSSATPLECEGVKRRHDILYHIPGQMLEGSLIQKRPRNDQVALDAAREVAKAKKFD